MIQYFYHQRIRKTVAVFGTLFNNIFILRKSATGETISQVKVPLSYAPKRDFIDRIAQTINGEEAERLIAVKLPRMSFEITSISYDSARQLGKTNKVTVYGTDDRIARLRQPVPYNIAFQLNIYAKSQDDALQVVEQIIPYFNPHYTITIKPFDGFDTIKEDLPLVLNSVSFSDDYEGMLEARRSIIYTLDFEMKVPFYPFIEGIDNNNNASVIETVINNWGLMSDENPPGELYERVTIELDPLGSGPDDDFAFKETWEILGDSDS